jgi:hypothetical protein
MDAKLHSYGDGVRVHQVHGGTKQQLDIRQQMVLIDISQAVDKHNKDVVFQMNNDEDQLVKQLSIIASKDDQVEETRNVNTDWTGRVLNYSTKVSQFYKVMESRVNDFKCKVLEVLDRTDKILKVEDSYVHEKKNNSVSSIDDFGEWGNQYQHKEEHLFLQEEGLSTNDEKEDSDVRENFGIVEVEKDNLHGEKDLKDGMEIDTNNLIELDNDGTGENAIDDAEQFEEMKDNSLKSNEKFSRCNLPQYTPQELFRLIKEDLGMLTESYDYSYNYN